MSKIEPESFTLSLRDRANTNSTISSKNSKDELKPEIINVTTENVGFFCFNFTRFFILCISLICFTLTLSNTVAFTFTVVCINDKAAATIINKFQNNNNNNNTDDDLKKKDYEYSEKEQALLFSAIAIGNFIGAIPLPYFNSKVGVRSVFTIYGFISAASTLLLPLGFYHGGLYFLFIIRIFQGIANSMGLPGIGAVLSEWATISGSGVFLAILSAQLQCAVIFTMPISVIFCESSIGWTGVYYLQGIITLIAFIIFFLFYRDSPKLHKNVSSNELGKILHGKQSNNNQKNNKELKTPYFEILKDKSVIGIFVSTVGGAFAFQLFAIYGPKYLNKVLKLDIQKTGLLAAIPFIGSLFMKIISGPISDKSTCISQKCRVLIFASISQYGMALCFILLAWQPFDDSLLASQILFTLTTVFSGINCVGVLKSLTLQSMQYAYFLMTMVAFINSGVVLILPPIVAFMVPYNTQHEWSIIFYIIGIFLAFTVTVFNFTCETKPRPWTYHPEPLPKMDS